MALIRGLMTLCWALLITTFAFAELQLHSYFSDHMVLQRDKPILIKGWASPGVMVMVEFGAQVKKTKADTDGAWAVTLDPLPANGTGSTLTCRSDEEIQLKNVVVGDVWLLGRQAYVDVNLGKDEAGKELAAKFSRHKNFRATVINTIPSLKPLDNLPKGAVTGWSEVDEKLALSMSAMAFHLGQDLSKEMEVPLGVVDLNMDRYFGIGWLSEKALSESIERYPKATSIPWTLDWMKEKAEAQNSGKAQKDLDLYHENQLKKSRGKPVTKPSLGLNPLKNPMCPSAGFNSVIHPLKNISFKGILLQLGNDYPFIAYRELDRNGTSTVTAELDAAWQENYMILKNGYRVTDKTLPYITQDWRRTLGDSKLPVGLILPPSSDLDTYAAHHREIRELHRRTSERWDGLGLILPSNANRPSSGQPANEKLLAQRAKQWILGAVNGKTEITPTGPLFDRVEAKISKATIFFKEGTAKGLKATGDVLQQFETAGPDRQFSQANAIIDGHTIKLSSEGPIQFVRFNWSLYPDQGLVNKAGLPAIPFNTDPEWTFAWIPPTENPNLPKEYSLTADKWGDSNVAIINGQIDNMAVGDSEQIPRRPGPLGIVASPFGPNIYVAAVEAGPAMGNLMVGDVIYGVNDQIFKDGVDVSRDESYKLLSSAISFSESEAGKGLLKLQLRRKGELKVVTLQLPIMGSYSSTTPYFCEKSENIITNAAQWSVKRYRPENGMTSEPYGMLNTDLLFLLATGDPKYQGLVRRAVYKMITKMTPVTVTEGMQSKPWTTGYSSLLLGEYFHATGDRNILAHLKYQADLSAESQIKPIAETPSDKEAAQTEDQVGGWRQNYPGNSERWKSGYGLMPHAGMTCVMGMQLAKEAGLKIDELALQRGANHYYEGRAEYASVVYTYWNSKRDGPPTMSPNSEANGKLWSMNGKLGTAAALYDMLDKKDAVDICSRYCTYGYNNTRHGHGGMFFNNFWTPIGAWAGGKESFKHFMKGQTWWRELFRRPDGSFNQVGRGKIGVSYGLPYVAHHQRLRILGAPPSAFGTNCPDYLLPAIEAHSQRDYEKSENLILKATESMVIPAKDKDVVTKTLESVRLLRASLEYDLEYVEGLIGDGKFYYASLELPQLQGTLPPNHPRLISILNALTSPEGINKVSEHRKVCEAEKSLIDAKNKSNKAKKKQKRWQPVIKKGSSWQMKVVEHVDHAPKTWTSLEYQDEDWNKAKLPISWTMYHTALFRGNFELKNLDVIKGLRVKGDFFQQANVVIHLNGQMVAKIDEIGKGAGTTLAPLNDFGLSQLREGVNTISISSRHKRRWGSYRGTYKKAATVGFSIETTKD